MHPNLSAANCAIIRNHSPSTAALITNGKIDAEFIAMLNRLLDAAREKGKAIGRAEARGLIRASNPAPRAKAPHPGFLVWNPSGPHRPGYVHHSLLHAVTEAKRMAVQHPDNNFYVLAPVSRAVSETTQLPVAHELVENGPAQLIDDLDDEIPF